MESSPDANSSSSSDSASEDSAEDTAQPDNYVHVRDSETNVESEDAPDIVLWGQLGSHGGGGPIAIYWLINPEALDEETDEDLLKANLIISLTGDNSADQFDPSLDRDQFHQRILNASVGDSAGPQASIEKFKSQLNEYLNETRIEWLRDFISNEDTDELKNWFEPLVDDFFEGGLSYFQVNASFLDSGEDLEDLPETPHDESDNQTEKKEDSDSGTKLNVSFVTSPSQGLPTNEIDLGTEVYFRITGSVVEHLPDHMVDEERSDQVSIPMVGPVVSIEDEPELTKDLDGEPEDYRSLSVGIEASSSVQGSGLVYKDDKIKVETQTESEQADLKDDIILLGSILGVLLLIFLVIYFL